jgi:hypothetical protein
MLVILVEKVLKSEKLRLGSNFFVFFIFVVYHAKKKIKWFGKKKLAKTHSFIFVANFFQLKYQFLYFISIF